MAKIVDPDQLNQGVEAIFDTAAKTYQLLVAGNLDDNSPGKSSGVTGQAFYSFSKEEWLATATLRKFRFPIDPIFEAKFNIVNGWAPKDDQTRDLWRDAGTQEQTTGRENACIISLGAGIGSADAAWLQQVIGFASPTIALDKTGDINEPFEIFDGAASDRRDFLKAFLRIQGKSIAEGNLLIDQDLSALTYQAYRLPLANAADAKIVASDITIDGNAPYTGMTINFIKGARFSTYATATVYAAGDVVLDSGVQSGGSSNGTWWFTPGGGTSSGADTGVDAGITDWESYTGEEQIGTEWFAFNVILLGNTGSVAEIYENERRQLRQTTDINDNTLGGANQNAYGTVNGEVSKILLGFVGDELQTRPGVLVRSFDTNDTNSIRMFDITVDGGGLDVEDSPLTTTARTFPFVSAGNMLFTENVVDEPDVDTVYDMYFQYTKRITATDIAVTASATNTCTLTSAGGDFTQSAGEYINVTGFLTNSVNNGIYLVGGTPTASSMDLTKVYDTADVLVDETAGDSVNVDDDPVNTPDALLVQDDTATDITGQVTAASIAFTFDYDNNNQGARAAGTDAPIEIHVQGKEDSKVQFAQFTITRSTGLSFPVNLNDDLVFLNP
jgi:hypothetical protein